MEEERLMGYWTTPALHTSEEIRVAARANSKQLEQVQWRPLGDAHTLIWCFFEKSGRKRARQQLNSGLTPEHHHRWEELSNGIRCDLLWARRKMRERSERRGVKELMQAQVWQNLLKVLLINYLTLCCSEESVVISWQSLLLHDDPWSLHWGTFRGMQSRQSHCQDALLFISVLSSLMIKYSSLKAAHKYKQTSLQTSATKVAIRRYHLI